MKRSLSFVFGTGIIILFFTQCSPTWVQLNVLKSTNCQEFNSHFQYSNDTMSISYMFWGENGNMLFTITNKLNIPIYIDWKKCNYILNGTKSEYYSETVTATTDTKGTTWNANQKEYRILNLYIPSYTQSTSITMVSKQERVTFIPPATTIVKSISGINKSILPIIGGEKAYIKKGGKYKLVRETLKYEAGTSPYVLRNYLTLSLKENFENEIFVDNKFYLAAIQDVHDTCVSQLAIDKTTMTTYMKEIDLDGKTFFVKYGQ